jgi:hypothetical protein
VTGWSLRLASLSLNTPAPTPILRLHTRLADPVGVDRPTLVGGAPDAREKARGPPSVIQLRRRRIVRVAAAPTADREPDAGIAMTRYARARKSGEHEVSGVLDDAVRRPLADDQIIQPGEGTR